MAHSHALYFGERHRFVERLGHVRGHHRRAEFVGDDEAREVIHHRRQVVPAPADDPPGVCAVVSREFGTKMASCVEALGLAHTKSQLKILALGLIPFLRRRSSALAFSSEVSPWPLIS